MSQPSPHFFITTSDANPALRLDETIGSVVTQTGNFHLSYLINDADQSSVLQDSVLNWRTKIDRDDLGARCKSLTIKVSHHAELSTGDSLNKILCEVPYDRNAIMATVPCGSELAPGALAVVADVMLKLPEVDLIKGLTAKFSHDGVLTALEEVGLYETWHSVGAAADVSFDRPAVRGGLFWRSMVWYRLGGIDPALDYAGDLDFSSKAAAVFRLATLEALLTISRPSRLEGGELQRRQAEVIAVQQRAALRQRRLFHQLLERNENDPRGASGIEPSLRICYDTDVRQWRRTQAQFLDRLGLVEALSGFLNPEGPYPDMLLPCRFRWTFERQVRFKITAVSPRQKIFLRLRNPTPNQAISLFLNNERIFRKHLTSTSLTDAQDISLDHTFRIGRNELTLVVDVMHVNGAGVRLGIIVESVEIVAVDP
jgi:hypothetical protein